MTIERMLGSSVRVLPLRDVARWQVDGELTSFADPEIVASLPALQRGAVWRPGQVEALWDSIACAFPIGSFLLMPYQEKFGTQKMLVGQQTSDATHMLLDGQQRANAIAIGFLAPWEPKDLLAPAALWIDLGAPPNADRTLHVRLVSRPHPWGYPATGDRQRLTTADIRNALKQFRSIESNVDWKQKPPVCYSWPWDAWIPVPLPVLLAAPDESPPSILATFSRMVPWWPAITTKHHAAGDTLQALLPEVLKNARQQITTLRRVVQQYRVPAINTDLGKSGMQGSGIAGSKDPAETLFLRVNAGGTPLQGEDLIYSMVKAIWPHAAELVTNIQHHLVSEPRAALLVARLALVEKDSNSLPPPPEVARFRRLVHGDPDQASYRKRLETYLVRKAVPIFRDAQQLLTSGGDFALPKVLAADLGRGEGGREILFLLLRWIERLHESKFAVLDLSQAQRKRTLGALTAISWFARRPEGCVSVLWPHLQKCNPADLPDFFERRILRNCLERDARRREPPMVLLPTPMALQRQVASKITAPRGNHAVGGFSDPRSAFWDNWKWYENFGEPSARLERWYGQAMAGIVSINTDEESWKERAALDWGFFADKLWGERRLVLHAQRHQLAAWFPDFDPTHPESVEEMNRPWDMDHIHPRYYIEGRHNVPQIVRTWHGSIGNLRAWPFDANRSDAEAPPSQKLGCESDDVLRAYGIMNSADIRFASFISTGQWKNWQQCTPDEPFPPRYLSMAANHGQSRIALVRAITSRTIALYQCWYDSLKISTLMPLARD
ncbi:DUF262 domain-containing protein [Variovorax sp. RB2P76]|uniref:DUF262 domain-containing protein n=1 Tax=Variovorax sp. RB2P76 TaxID=3443736 RepID=UPI003F4858D3